MISSGNIALHATWSLTTLYALHLRRITTAILEEDDLFMLSQCLLNPFYQRIGEMIVHLFALILLLEINESDIRQFHAAKAFREGN